MIVTNLTGESELLVDYSGLKRTRKVNGDYSLSFAILKTEKNQHAYPLVAEESILEYDGQQYRIKDVTEVLVGVTPIKTVQASHIFFDLVDTYKYDYLYNTQTLTTCLQFALSGTGYTFDVVDSFANAVFEKFGEDTSLALVQTALNVFGAEVSINNKHLTFKRQIGTDTEIQIRYGYNVQVLEKYVNTNNLSTRIRGFGKKNEDGSYVVSAEYTSPMAAIYGIRDAKPIYDERYTDYDSLLERIQSELMDEPQIGFKVDALELKKMGVLTEQLYEGDRVFVIYEPLGIDLTARVLEIVDYPESSQPAEYTFGNFLNGLTSELAGFQKTKDNVDAILNGEKKLPYNVLDDAVLRATEALNSAATELIFDNGIIARDPRNPNWLVLLNSKGIGISRDGGATFTEAITADGFVLSAGAIGQLNANNINVSGVVSAINDDDTLTFMASKVDLFGKVTFNMFDTSTKEAINSKTDASKVSEIINQTTIDGGKVTIVNNADFVNAKNKADNADNLTQLWRYGTTTEIDGGDIRTGTISAGKVTVGADTTFEQGYDPSDKTDATDVSNIISQTTIDGGKVTITNNANFQNVASTASNASSTASSASSTASDAYYAANNASSTASSALSTANTAKSAADSVSSQLNLWKYPGTTYIDGGDIYTNTILANAIKAGILTGFTIQTDPYSWNPRVYMGGSKFEATNGSNKIIIDPALWNGNASLQIETSSTNINFQAFDNRNTLNSNGAALEIWSLSGLSVIGDLDVRGSKNASVPTSIGRVNVSAYETAEYYFGDIGRGKVINGECRIEIESLFAETVNTNMDYEVFLTPYGRGIIYVNPEEDMQSDHFVVRGDDIPFAYEIKAKRLGYEDVRLELSKGSEVEEFVQDASQE